MKNRERKNAFHVYRMYSSSSAGLYTVHHFICIHYVWCRTKYWLLLKANSCSQASRYCCNWRRKLCSWLQQTHWTWILLPNNPVFTKAPAAASSDCSREMCSHIFKKSLTRTPLSFGLGWPLTFAACGCLSTLSLHNLSVQSTVFLLCLHCWPDQ